MNDPGHGFPSVPECGGLGNPAWLLILGFSFHLYRSGKLRASEILLCGHVVYIYLSLADLFAF